MKIKQILNSNEYKFKIQLKMIEKSLNIYAKIC